jgi:hypothetical protein
MKPWKTNNPKSTNDVWDEPYRKTVDDVLKETEEDGKRGAEDEQK